MVAPIDPAVSAPSPAAALRAAAARQEARHDAGLVIRFVAGDEAAFVEIVTRYRARMLQVALNLLRNRADAEEIAQDTFIRAHRGLARFRGDSSLVSWLHRITLNLSRNRYWYHFRRHRHASLPLDAAFSETNRATFGELVASDAPGPVREAATTEFASFVTACMARLPASQQQVLRLRNTQHLSYEFISRSLGIGLGTVKSRIARARKNLRGLLIAVYPELASDASPLACFEPLRTSTALRAICA